MGKKNKSKNSNKDTTLVKETSDETEISKTPVTEHDKERKLKRKQPSEVLDTTENNASSQGTTKVNKKIKGVENTKITFGDNGEASSEVKSTSSKRHKPKPVNEEDEVRDEDIDKFCDELNDEDNQEYENWVKLIEEKLHAKKKT